MYVFICINTLCMHIPTSSSPPKSAGEEELAAGGVGGAERGGHWAKLAQPPKTWAQRERQNQLCWLGWYSVWEF